MKNLKIKEMILMEKLLILKVCLIFLIVIGFSFINNVSAYREDDRYINFDLSSITKDSFVFSDSTNNYFDDLVKIDNFLKEQGVHYNIWLLKDSNNKFSAFRVYVNRFFDNGTPYNKYTIMYYAYDTDRMFINYENTTSYSNLTSPIYIDTVSKLDELITSINTGTNPFTPGSKNTNFNGILHPYARDNTCNNQFLGDYKCRTTQEFYVPFSTSDTIQYGDMGNAYKLSYISPKNDFYLIESGHTMPLLIDYIDTKIINPYDFSRYFNEFEKLNEKFIYEDEIIKELKKQKLKYAIVHANASVTPNDFYPDYNYISNMYGIYICDDNVTEIKIYQEMSSTSGSGANKVQYYNNRFLPNTGYSSCRFKLIDTQATETELYNSKDFTTGFNTLTTTLFQPSYQTNVYENLPNRSEYKFFYSSNMNIKMDGMYHEIHINDVQYKNGDRYPIYDEIVSVNNGEDYNQNLYFTNSIGGTLYSIQYLTTDNINEKIQIVFKYNGESKPTFNGINTYGLRKIDNIYKWTTGLGYSSLYDTGLSVGNYTETYENNIYTLTLENIRVEDLNNEFEKIIINFEFLFANNISDIEINSDTLTYSNFNFNTFGYDHIIDNFNTSEFSYINFTTTLDEYRDVMYLIGTSNTESSNLIFADYFSIESNRFIDYGILSEVYNKNLFGYEFLKQFTFNIGTNYKTGFWLTRNLTDDINSIHPLLGNVEYNHFDFSIAYKLNENLYFSINTDYDNQGAIIVDGTKEDGSPNIKDSNINISPDILTPNDFKSFFDVINEFLEDLKETRNYINDLYNYFYYSLPVYLRIFHNFVIIILCLLIFVKVGVEQ